MAIDRGDKVRVEPCRPAARTHWTCSPSSLKAVVSTNLRTGISASVHAITMQLLKGSCSVCMQPKLIKPTYQAQDDTWIEDYVQPLSVISSDITGPILEATCQGMHVVHFACMSTKIVMVQKYDDT